LRCAQVQRRGAPTSGFQVVVFRADSATVKLQRICLAQHCIA
jgi:hypothetical protein